MSQQSIRQANIYTTTDIQTDISSSKLCQDSFKDRYAKFPYNQQEDTQSFNKINQVQNYSLTMPIQTLTQTIQIQKEKQKQKENQQNNNIQNLEKNKIIQVKQGKKSKKINQMKSLSQDKQLLKKINLQKLKQVQNLKNKSKQKKQVHRKRKPQIQTSLQKMQQVNEKKTHKQIMQNCQKSVITKFRANKYLKKNYQFQHQITKVKDLNDENKTVTIRGQIMFIWGNQNIDQKWARTQMICFQMYDGTGSVMIAFPQKIFKKKILNIQIGNWLKICKLQVKYKYPKHMCLLITQNSQIKQLTINQVPQNIIIQPQKLGITVKQLQNQPIGRICNVVCLIIYKNERQYIKTSRGNNLVLSKLIIYDPIDKKQQCIKLWQQKSEIKFYQNCTVYLLRGIQIKQFKGQRQYHACKDFNYRSLKFSAIQHYLTSLYQNRWGLLAVTPNKYHKISIQQCKNIVTRKSKKFMQKRMKIIKQNAPQQFTYKNSQQIQQKLQLSPISITSQSQYEINQNPKIFISYSQNPIKLINIQIQQNYQRKYVICIQCKHKAMINCYGEPQCLNCGNKQNKYQYIYYIKCQFSDGKQNYLGQMSQQVAQKLFSVNDEITKMDFFQKCFIGFKRNTVKYLIGVAVNAIIATTRQEIDQNIWVYGYYIIDILPFQDLETQDNQQNNKMEERVRDRDGRNLSNGKSQVSNKYDGMASKIAKHLK